MNVFVTGGTGYVGSKIIESLIENNHKVFCLVRSNSVNKIANNNKIIPIVADVLNPLSITLKEIDSIIHLVAIIKEKPENDVTFEKLNYLSAKNMIDIAKRDGVKQFILMSAVSNPPGILSGYYHYKLMAENYLKKSGLNWTIFKPSLIYDKSWKGKSVGWIKLFNWIFLIGGLLPGIGNWIKKWQPISRTNIAKAFLYAVENESCINKTFSGKDLFNIL
ncbi:MAG: NAD(P)H-binding protein [Spirochaetota bacterium]|nr:NAD(P)H-binding protein [Spirochaetota bacterium]